MMIASGTSWRPCVRRICTASLGRWPLKALAVDAIPTPWLHQETTTLPLYGAYAGGPAVSAEEKPETGEEGEPTTPPVPQPA
jgi:hypothetical protein